VAASGEHVVLNDVVEPRGVGEFGRVVVDPAAHRPVVVVDFDGHTRRRPRAVIEAVSC